ncbi:unnamed protein product [Phaedon cochleariae]|uniref:Sugar phosphate phosphatase n=1 Tax=Phaedon cochleariae TaxID=80249 RepID=A0A9P0DYU9_PHACE|nr:unnamed protein product [Phaedon cochleariae]
MCDCESNRSMDVKTPRNVYLSGFYKRSFAFYTIKNRMPVIITSLLDNLARNKLKLAEKYEEEAKEEIKTVIGQLSKLKYEIQTNKPLKLLSSQAADAKIYNEYITRQANEEGHATYFHTIWLLAECYMYRRIWQIFETMSVLKNFDPFQDKKEESFFTALPLIEQMGKYLWDSIHDSTTPSEDEFVQFMKLNLWGNKCDLSLSLGKVTEENTLFDISSLDKQILSDYSTDIWKAISACDSSSDIVDIVFDNAGYEVFTDLCLADYMIAKQLAKTIRLYVKTIPWFISDVMTHDFHWMLQQLKSHENHVLQNLGERWQSYIDNGTWLIVESDFWTLPFDYTYMARVDQNLYKQLAEAKLAIFKGDLNYRKLFGEKNWDPTTSVDQALQNFNPTKLAILRTIKADIVCGLEEGIAEKIEAEDPKWMETGNWGLIQYSNKIVEIK